MTDRAQNNDITVRYIYILTFELFSIAVIF